MLQEKLIGLKKNLIEQAYLVLNMIETSFQGLLDRDPTRLKKVHQMELQVNQTEIEIDAVCTNLIALYHPEAKALRTILMIMKMNCDIERMGDLAVSSAKSADFLIRYPHIKPVIDLASMARETIQMYKNSISAFIQEDVELSNQVCRKDSVVDNLNSKIFMTLIKEIVPQKPLVESAFHVNNIAKNLERIADLATNLAENIIFIAEGRVIKHNLNKNRTKVS